MMGELPLNEDDLLPTSNIVIRENREIHVKPDGPVVYPDPQIRTVFKILVMDQELWGRSSIAVRTSRPIYGRAPVRGVRLMAAIKEAKSRGCTYSVFRIINSQNESDFDAILGLKIDRRGRETHIQAWDLIGSGSELFYFHVIAEGDTVIHFDGAKITPNLDQSACFEEIILEDASKLKNNRFTTRNKLFRFDGNTSYFKAFNVASQFFPDQALAQDAFEINELKLTS